MKLIKIGAVWVGCWMLSSQAFSENAWTYSGSNTLKIEHYQADNNGLGSPYPDLGEHYFNEFNVGFGYQNDNYEIVQGQLFGLANDSSYRSAEQGGILEHASLSYANGAVAVPFRVEVGDIYAYFSQRTVQRTLKGLQLELQPFQAQSNLHSIVLYTGATQQSYRELAYSARRSSGASWVIEQNTSALVFNAIHTATEGALSLGTLDQEHAVLSVAGETLFNVGSHTVSIETEWAHFNGDHGGDLGDANDGQGKQDSGVFVQLKGTANRQLNYRVRVEQYGHDFRPYTNFINDRRSAQAFAGWRFSNGLDLRGRYQTFEDRFDSFNPLDTDVIGLDLSGRLLPTLSNRINGRARFSQEYVEDQQDSIERKSLNFDTSVSFPITRQFLGSSRVYYNKVDDYKSAGDVTTKQISLSSSSALSAFGFKGSWAPGISVSEIDTEVDRTVELAPTFSVNGFRGGHNVRMSYGLRNQNRSESQTALDSVIRQLGLHYHYRLRQQEFGLDLNFFERDREQAERLDANKASLYWTYHFDGPARASAGVRSFTGDEAYVLSAKLLSQVMPLQSFYQVQNSLKRAGAISFTERAEGVVYELTLLDEVDLRQRFAVLQYGGVVNASALIIDFETFASAQEMRDQFLEVSRSLSKVYGKPSSVFETGDFTDDLSNQLRQGGFVRIQEWNTADGVLRLGIPQRLDNQVRIEVQHKVSFPSPGQGQWSIDAVE